MSQITEELNEALKNLNDKIEFDNINKSAKNISNRYRANKNDGKRLVTEYSEAVSYAFARMPSTYEAVHKALEKTFEINSFKIDTILDIGAGTGTATWACYDVLGKKIYTCAERESTMLSIGKELMKNNEILKNTEWKKIDIANNDINVKADLVVTSYMINELSKEEVESVALKLWNATNKVLLIIEPGTPHGFSNIKNIRNIIINNGGNIIAPCTHQNECPLPHSDWCSFSCRVQRSRTQRILKEGTMSYEDEKFSYIAFSKQSAQMVENRILRHPVINKGYSEYKVCTREGIKNIRLSKKDGLVYKNAKKKNSGDNLNLEITI